MPHLHDKNKKQPKSSAAANSPHFQQEGIASFLPPQFKATAGPIPQMKENEEEKAEALQKKQAQSEVEGKNNNSFVGGDTPVTPPNPNENILATLQRKHNAYRPEPKQYKRYELPTQQKLVKQFKQVEPFQLKDSPAYQKSQGGLPQEVQAKMENSMGHDFSNVNIHKDSSNATDAGALAYAQGNDVHFAPGQFKPDTTRGQELIGHELAHVVQQREGRVKPTKVLGKGMAVNDDPGLEKEADDMGKKAAQGKFEKGVKKDTSIASNNLPLQRQEAEVTNESAVPSNEQENNQQNLINTLVTWIDGEITNVDRRLEERREDYRTRNWAIDENEGAFLTLHNRRNTLLAHKTTYEGLTQTSADALTLANVIYNEAGVESAASKNAIAYAYLNRTGGVVREPVGAGISNHSNLETRWANLDVAGKLTFLNLFSSSISAAERRLVDNAPEENDPTNGARHWVSPEGLPTTARSGFYHRTYDGLERYFPNWARDPDSSEAEAYIENGTFQSNYDELTAPGVPGRKFLFYTGVN